MRDIDSLKIPQWEEKGYPKGQEDKIIQLFSKAFNGRILSMERLTWLARDNPVLQYCAASLWDRDILVAYNAFTPVNAYIKGEKVIVGLSGTTMSNDDYLGVSIQLAKHCNDICSCMKMVYGFPNVNSYKISIKYCGMFYIGDIAFWTADSIEGELNIHVVSISQFDDDFVELARSLSKNHYFIRSRDASLLNWRFFKKPHGGYQCFVYEINNIKRGYIVTSIYRDKDIRQFQIVDILADSWEVFYELLIYAKHKAFVEQCEIVKLWLTSKAYCKVLEEAGFCYGEHPFPLTASTPEMSIHDSYITMADSDIF